MRAVLTVLAFIVAQSNPAEAFIAESARAVLKIREGVWGMKGTGDDGRPLTLNITRKNGTVHLRQTSAGAVLFESLIGPTSALAVYPTQRKYLSQTYPRSTVPEEPEPLPPLEEGELKFNVSEEHGFTLRSNPGFTESKIVVAKSVEILTATIRKKDGRTGGITLVRNAKTKLPTRLKVATPDTTSDFELVFEVRKVLDKEMKIAPETCKGFERIEPPSGNL